MYRVITQTSQPLPIDSEDRTGLSLESSAGVTRILTEGQPVGVVKEKKRRNGDVYEYEVFFTRPSSIRLSRYLAHTATSHDELQTYVKGFGGMDEVRAFLASSAVRYADARCAEIESELRARGLAWEGAEVRMDGDTVLLGGIMVGALIRSGGWVDLCLLRTAPNPLGDRTESVFAKLWLDNEAVQGRIEAVTRGILHDAAAFRREVTRALIDGP